MKRWEYQSIDIMTMEEAEVLRQLDNMGTSGWELFHILVSPVLHSGIATRYFFKRELPTFQ